MGGQRPKDPVIFQKSSGCLVPYGHPIQVPSWSTQVDHELEIALKLDDNLNPTSLALALDLTARDVQSKAKSQGLPWDLAKSFKGSCPLTPWISLADTKLEKWQDLTFELKVNGDVRQKSQGKNMLWTVPEILTHLTQHFPMKPGDILLTGTPQGVGPVRSGDTLTLTLEGFEPWTWNVI
jgi:acylpyruvate hydrolase